MQQNSSYIDQDIESDSSPLQAQAEELMNSLFSDVEQTLEISTTSTSSYLTSDIVSYDREAGFYQSGQTSLAISRVTKVDQAITIHQTKVVSRAIAPIKPSIASTTVDSLDSPQSSADSLGFIDSILLGSAFTSAVFALILGLINLKTPVSTPQVVQNNLQAPPTNDLSAPIAENLRRSLWEIKPANSTESPNQNTDPNSADKSATPAVKPIYIPIYQPPTPAPSSETSITAPVPEPVVAVTPPKKDLPKGSYTLIGVLELGDRSSAIFDINGSVQSIKLGAGIGESGWVINRIEQQKAILKRNNEDMTVTVGQKF